MDLSGSRSAHLVHLALVGVKGDVEENLKDLHGTVCHPATEWRQLFPVCEPLAGHFVRVRPAHPQRGVQGLGQQADPSQVVLQLGAHVHADGGQHEDEAEVEEEHLVVPLRLAALLQSLGHAHHQLKLRPQALCRLAVEHHVAQALEGLHDALQVGALGRGLPLPLQDGGVVGQRLHGGAAAEGGQAALVAGQDADGLQAGQLTGGLQLSLQVAQHQLPQTLHAGPQSHTHHQQH